MLLMAPVFSIEIVSGYMSKQLSKTSFGSCISILADKLENLPLTHPNIEDQSK